MKWAFDFERLPGHFELAGVESDVNVTEKECRMMVRPLFVDRFKLKMYSETRQISAYAFVVNKRRPKFSVGGKVRIKGAIKQAASEREAPDRWTMTRLSNYLASVRGVSRKVVDRTGLPGAYVFIPNYSTAENDDHPNIFHGR